MRGANECFRMEPNVARAVIYVKNDAVIVLDAGSDSSMLYRLIAHNQLPGFLSLRELDGGMIGRENS